MAPLIFYHIFVDLEQLKCMKAIRVPFYRHVRRNSPLTLHTREYHCSD